MNPSHIRFQFVSPEHIADIDLIAGWYASEWEIPQEKSIEKLRQLPSGDHQFQVLMLLNDVPVASGGVYNHVGILDKVPHLNAHKHWMALVYTLPEFRQRGYGVMLCNFLEEHARILGLKELYLFTHTAESLYRRLFWQPTERIRMGAKEIVVMKKVL